ncbi:hypothetical protein MPSEU_000516600 [Mayamaea pseudoterrestris]|nr:hypothetical protein MPSEU_000516600 [Mayamaea pseudoterrestris]
MNANRQAFVAIISITFARLVANAFALVPPWSWNPTGYKNFERSIREIRCFGIPGAGVDQQLSVKVFSSADAASDLTRRGKVNEIDFCIAPADVSLSRAYGTKSTSNTEMSDASSLPILSLTRALNNASNRAVRRILLARSWPSAEALNLSLQRVAAAERALMEQQQKQESTTNVALSDAAKCPVPRPILDVLTRNKKRDGLAPKPRSRTDQEYVVDQMQAFSKRYGELPGYQYADAYLECILSLATTGKESVRVQEIYESAVYDEAYRRVLGVLKTVGVVFQESDQGLEIAADLIDQDICLSIVDRFASPKKSKETVNGDRKNDTAGQEVKPVDSINDMTQEKSSVGDATGNGFHFFKRDRQRHGTSKPELSNEDLGGVLLSKREPSMTRQLNVLSNIAWRALLFGGDQELVVLAETLDADRAAFVERWYPNTGGVDETLAPEHEQRPGVQFLNCLIDLLRECYMKGAVTDLEPRLPLPRSYANSYERLVASAVELGSGYIRPVPDDINDFPKPKTSLEELGRFAIWESTYRKSQPSMDAYPEDLEGGWGVCDMIGGESIGSSTVWLESGGRVKVDPPLEGLRWRLDPGPTHLDTCTFQVLSSDGTILQYRGFIDRGARLESRFSKRSLTIRGSVEFQMRDSIGALGYYKDILPINYKTGTTKFVMTKL